MKFESYRRSSNLAADDVHENFVMGFVFVLNASVVCDVSDKWNADALRHRRSHQVPKHWAPLYGNKCWLASRRCQCMAQRPPTPSGMQKSTPARLVFQAQQHNALASFTVCLPILMLSTSHRQRFKQLLNAMPPFSR
ncbi:Protease HtpX [Trichinella spiralis]|uniref:Protease HtpX n=1 Tax=Trichinella spiralis TaxID=6334 RepID=A0ABR3KET9_TRISP